MWESHVRLVRMPSTLGLKPLPYAGTVDDAPSGDALQGHAKGKVGGGEMSIILPEKVLKEVEKVSRREETLPEEIVSRAVIEFLKIDDPQTKAELHENLCKKFLNDA